MAEIIPGAHAGHIRPDFFVKGNAPGHDGIFVLAPYLLGVLG
jgi:hypothetical protein